MTLWLDAQLPPALAAWMTATWGVPTQPVRSLGLRDSSDQDIFDAARAAAAVVMTKDADFVELVERLGSPPQVLWLTCGNTSNVRLREILTACWPRAMALLESGESLIEINDTF
jgi:predicted nuclease of predicted toxin-antitoxin system